MKPVGITVRPAEGQDEAKSRDVGDEPGDRSVGAKQRHEPDSVEGVVTLGVRRQVEPPARRPSRLAEQDADTAIRRSDLRGLKAAGAGGPE